MIIFFGQNKEMTITWRGIRIPRLQAWCTVKTPKSRHHFVLIFRS